MKPVEIYKTPLRHDEEILFSLKEFKGNQYFDVRIFFQSKKDGTFYPSKKGLTLGVGLIDEISHGLEEVKKALSNKEVLEEVKT